MQQACEAESFWRDVDWDALLWQLLSALERLSSLHPLAVIARKRLDISFFPDIVRAVRLSLMAMLPGGAGEVDREKASLQVARAWVPDRANGRKRSRPGLPPVSREDATATPSVATVAPFLSVRTAFDLYLKALELPRGSLVVCSALTIPDMVTIFEEHGLVPVPVDLDPDTLAPEAGALDAELEKCCAKGGGEDCGGRVRAIYVAHVFGAQVEMTQIVEAAARHGVLLWEDCAQVFTGRQGYLGHAESDAVFFSFGVIKRATALGGAVARIGDTEILAAMLREEATYPVQSSLTYLYRVLKCSLLLILTSPLLYGVIIHTLGLMGIEHDKAALQLGKGFPQNGLLKAIRHKPSVALLQMLAWRITRYTPEGVEVRLRHCNRMLRLLKVALARQPHDGRAGSQDSVLNGLGAVLPGIRAHRHTLWLYPVIVSGGSARADALVGALLREGFDATRAPTSLVPINRCTTTGRQDGCLIPRCSVMMDALVYLPLANNIPDSELDRMVLVLARTLLSSSVAPNEDRLGVGAGLQGGNGRGRREATQRLIAFAFRLDVIAGSVVCTMLWVTLAVLARML